MNEPQPHSQDEKKAGNHQREFICGVVEGFYGKPWTFEQRKDLFRRLSDLKLNSFMYAPKDDTKHRAKWRQPYSEFEANQLRVLIHEAKFNGIDFYYSLAPGLDMVYSDRGEIELLLRKFDQLVGLGCESFAILFDDIEPTCYERDREVFKNYAAAQVSVTNVVFEHLNRPKFLFCPTEYCESRAVPTVASSSYLNTIGAGLLSGIDIMWSGPRVISRFITEESIETLTKVIQRPPVIWENLHANDYDKKRVFLGPYSGRSTKIIPKLRGVLTNPNCEYEANYVAIHTLAQWSKCTEDINAHNRCNLNRRLSIGERTSQQHHHQASNTDVYDPDRALLAAIRDWLPYIREKRSLPMGINLSVHSKERDDDAASTQLVAQQEPVNEEMMDEETNSSTGSNTKSDMDMSSSPAPVNPIETNSCDSCDMPDASEGSTTTTKLSGVNKASDAAALDCLMCSMAAKDSKAPTTTTTGSQPISDQLSLESLSLLVDLFYLPFEHGLHGCALLREIQWIRDNSDIIISENSKPRVGTEKGSGAGSGMLDIDKSDQAASEKQQRTGGNQAQQEVDVWLERAERLSNLCTSINRLVNTLIHDCPNKLLIMELYPYLAEMRDVISMITDYVKFLRYRSSTSDRFYYSSNSLKQQLQQTKEAPAASDQTTTTTSNTDNNNSDGGGNATSTIVVTAEEQEPWVHRGGLIGDVQRLLS